MAIAFIVLTLRSFRAAQHAANHPRSSASAISILLVVRLSFGQSSSSSILALILLGLAVGIDYALIFARLRFTRALLAEARPRATRRAVANQITVVFAGMTVMRT